MNSSCYNGQAARVLHTLTAYPKPVTEVQMPDPQSSTLNGNPKYARPTIPNYKAMPEYQTWRDMLDRVLRPSHPKFHYYGGRGIRVCERWMLFENFWADMGKRPEGRYSLERRNNNGNYEPENCCWATQREQCNNTRRTRIIEHKGKRQSIAQWARELNIRDGQLRWRLDHHWSIQAALETPFIPRCDRYSGRAAAERKTRRIT